MSDLLERYAEAAGHRAVHQLRELAEPLAGKTIVHVNSTRQGGGVAEILEKLVPLSRELGLDARWEVMTGEGDFYRCTKAMHNALQGAPVDIPASLLEEYEETNRRNAHVLGDLLADADVVFIHDPQPAPLIAMVARRRGSWIWRCHIDLSHPHRPVWRYLQRFVSAYDASVFSLADYARRLDHPQYLIPPSIDPLSEKNMALSEAEIRSVAQEFEIRTDSPLLVQVSRFDRFKDPVGVVRAYHLSKRFFPDLQLVLVGGPAADDPEGAEVLEEVRLAVGDDPYVRVLLLPPDSHRKINALQRLADIVLQKSVREGFGLTVTEAMWKGKPVIGGNAGGIRLQVMNGHNGYLVNTPEGAALRVRGLLRDPQGRSRMGRVARAFARENFLLTRLLREHLTLIWGLGGDPADRIDLTRVRRS